MASYIGATPQIGGYHKLDAITTDGSASYTMQLNSANFTPESANHLIVSVNGVIQAPTDSFTVSGSTITFASTLSVSDTIDFIMALGNVLDIGVPSDSTVSLSKLTATGTKDSTTFLRGDNTFAVPSGGVNTPYFQAKKTTTQNFSQNTQAVVLFDSEDFDDDGVYDTSTGKFQPNEAGKYLIHTQVTFANSGGNEYCVITKNGTAIKWGQNYPTGTAGNKKQDTSVIVSLNGSTDYVQVEALTSYAGTNTLSTSLLGTGDACTFYGFKIIE